MRFVVLCLTCCLAINLSFGQQEVRVSPDGHEFLVYTPPGYSTQDSYPVLLYLHGGASIGDDITGIFNPFHQSPPNLINQNRWPSSYPFIVVSPHLKRDLDIDPNDQEWPVDLVDDVLEYVISEYSVDQDRIYMTGISLGGAGVWTYTAAFPSKITAIAPIAGKTDLLQACSLKNIPIWVFHGANDGLVVTDFSEDMVSEIRNCVPSGDYSPHLTLLNAKQHEGWNDVYDGSSGYELFDWFLLFNKSSPQNIAPVLKVTSPSQIDLSDGTFSIHHELFDPEGDPIVLTVNQLAGPAASVDVDSFAVEVTPSTAGLITLEYDARDDNGGVTTEIIDISVVNSSSTNKVTDLLLLDASDDSVIKSIEEGDIINLFDLGVSDVNVLAVTESGVNSVRFMVNGNSNTRISNSPFTVYRQSTFKEWPIREFPFVISAIPYSSSFGNGDEGIATSRKFTVFDIEPVTYYNKPGEDITLLSSWASNPDGSGQSPQSFNTHFQSFYLQSNTNLQSEFVIGGVASKLIIESTKSLILNAELQGEIHLEPSSTLNCFSPQSNISFGYVDPSSTINIHSTTLSTKNTSFGNLSLIGQNPTLEVQTEDILIKGSLSIEETGSFSCINCSSARLTILNDLTLQGSLLGFSELSFSGGQQSVFSTSTASLSLEQVSISNDTEVTVLANPSQFILELGSLNGGGLEIEQNSVLDVSDNHLRVIGDGIINQNSSPGIVAINGGSISITSANNGSHKLMFDPSSNTIESLFIDIPTGTELTLLNDLNVLEKVNLTRGSLSTNTALTLRSQGTTTAIIDRLGTNSTFTGTVEIEFDFSGDGRIWKYFAPPLNSTTVLDLQQFIPITGDFTGATDGFTNNPSMYRYDATGSTWLPFPENSNTEQLVLGTGYSLFIRPASIVSPLSVSGEIQTGTFNIPVADDPDSGNPNDGWNLIANPYPAAIQWNPSDWIKSGLSNAVFVRDNNNGRLLVWDGSTGDSEFSGRIAMGQAFWIQSQSATPVLTVQETNKISERNVSLLDENHFDFLNIELVVNGMIEDRAFISARGNDGSTYNENQDVIKKLNENYNLSTSSSDGIDLAINYLSMQDCEVIVPVKLTTKPGTSKQKVSFGVDTNILDKYSIILRSGEYELIFDQMKRYADFEIQTDTTLFELVLSRKVSRPLIEATNAPCGKKQELYFLNRTEFNEYRIMINGQEVQNTPDDTREDTLVIDRKHFTIGENKVVIEAVSKKCDHKILSDTLMVAVKEIILNEDISIQLCGDSAELTLPDVSIPTKIEWFLSTDTLISFHTGNSLPLGHDFLPSEIYFQKYNPEFCVSNKKGIVIIDYLLQEPPIIDFLDGLLVSNYEFGNQWYLNDKALTGDTTRYLLPLSDGVYHSIVKHDDCTRKSNAINYLISATKEPNSELVVYPNPIKAGSELHIKSKYQITKYQLKSQNSHVILQDELLYADELNIRLPSNSTPGIYTLIIYQESGLAIHKLVID